MTVPFGLCTAIYNSWQGAWPEDVSKFDGTDPRNISAEDLQLFGCAAADAWNVRRILMSPDYSGRRTLRDSYLPFSRPWSMIFPTQAQSTKAIASDVLGTLSSWLPGQRRLASPEEPPDRTRSLPARRHGRDRIAVYRDPRPIQRPPDYVFDLLEGSIRPRRLKPLARRVIILSDPG